MLGAPGAGRGAGGAGRRASVSLDEEAFGERFHVELQPPLWRRDRSRNRWLPALAEPWPLEELDPALAIGDSGTTGVEVDVAGAVV